MAGSYICDPNAPGCPDETRRHPSTGRYPTHPDERHCWHESTRRRLEWQYGENRVNPADISAWNSLGQRREIAA